MNHSFLFLFIKAITEGIFREGSYSILNLTPLTEGLHFNPDIILRES